MVENTDISISIDDHRIKDIAEAITNKTCKKILNYLTKNEKTISEISVELNIPINTVEYNIKKLLNSGLIEKKSFWWSVKGKKMPTYTVSNKRIIISPKRYTNNLKYLIALGITGVISLVIKKVTEPVKIIYEKNIPLTNELSGGLMKITRDSFLENAPQQTDQIINTITYFPKLGFGEWFLFGAWFVILLFFIFSIINERRSK
ncbi:MAG: helix-turn-helix domain-containing protein [Candidatus Pacearchaeota archaeon]